MTTAATETATDAKVPGRVYGLPGEPGVRSGAGYRFFTHTGAKLARVFRVEFDADADEGMASVSMSATDAAGGALLDPEANESVTFTARLWVRGVPPGQTAPLHTPDAVLYRAEGGRIVRHETDPIPDAAVRAAGGQVLEEVK
jgi:hypothetical protein